MRVRLAVVSASALLLAAIPLVVLAVTIRNGSRLDHQRARVRASETSSTNTDWEAVPGLGNLDICAKGQVTATVSMVLQGAPADVRVSMDGPGPLMNPRQARFDPLGGTNSFSFSFVIDAQTFEGSDGHLFAVEWRSPSGAETTLRRGDVNVLFRVGDC